ncbi:uncharacterized protein [Amphiura filiformis]|uniref:uncharacterized protein n=1 Tax=Amphiura filiformis TaxID=82378 RepID=UPI003B21D431
MSTVLISSADFTCPPNLHTCNNNNCVPVSWLCDGFNNCGDGSDEYPIYPTCEPFVDCPNGLERCPGVDNVVCIYPEWRCDGSNDCGDWSDENQDWCVSITCPEYWYRCADNMQCIQSHYFCDGFPECRDESDESINYCTASSPVVPDTTPPKVTFCPQDNTVDVPQGTTSATALWIEPTALDDVTPSSLLTVNRSHTSGDMFNLGTTNVVYNIADAAGNIASCTFIIVVLTDTEIGSERLLSPTIIIALAASIGLLIIIIIAVVCICIKRSYLDPRREQRMHDIRGGQIPTNTGYMTTANKTDRDSAMEMTSPNSYLTLYPPREQQPHDIRGDQIPIAGYMTTVNRADRDSAMEMTSLNRGYLNPRREQQPHDIRGGQIPTVAGYRATRDSAMEMTSLNGGYLNPRREQQPHDIRGGQIPTIAGYMTTVNGAGRDSAMEMTYQCSSHVYDEIE